MVNSEARSTSRFKASSNFIPLRDIRNSCDDHVKKSVKVASGWRNADEKLSNRPRHALLRNCPNHSVYWRSGKMYIRLGQTGWCASINRTSPTDNSTLHLLEPSAEASSQAILQCPPSPSQDGHQCHDEGCSDLRTWRTRGSQA